MFAPGAIAPLASTSCLQCQGLSAAANTCMALSSAESKPGFFAPPIINTLPTGCFHCTQGCGFVNWAHSPVFIVWQNLGETAVDPLPPPKKTKKNLLNDWSHFGDSNRCFSQICSSHLTLHFITVRVCHTHTYYTHTHTRTSHTFTCIFTVRALEQGQQGSGGGADVTCTRRRRYVALIYCLIRIQPLPSP